MQHRGIDIRTFLMAFRTFLYVQHMDKQIILLQIPKKNYNINFKTIKIMKTKRLLTGLMALAVTLTMQATDYFYTNSARYKVIGENLFTQGSPEDNPSAWKNHGGISLDQAVTAFAVENEGGPDGGKYLKVLSSGEDAGILNSDVMLEAGGLYLVTYKVKGTAARTNNNLGTKSSNTQNFFVNADGSLNTSASGYKAVSNQFYYYDEWQQVNATVAISAETPLFLVATFYNLLEGDGFADFAVYPVEKVSDDRVLQRYIDRAKLLLTIPELTNGRGALQGMLEEMETFIETNESDSEQTDYLEGLKSRITKFLDANGADAAPYFTNFTFDQTSNPKANAAVSGWGTGSRWGSENANAIFETIHAVQWIGNNYELGRGAITQERALPAGKYLMVISAMGYDNPNKSDIIDYKAKVKGIRMFINADSLELEDLPSWNPKSYAKVFTVNEGENVKVGVQNEAVSNSNFIAFDNHYLYLLGSTTEQLDDFVNAKKLADAQTALQTVINQAKDDLVNAEYIFGKDVLTDSITKSEQILAAETFPATSPDVLATQKTYMQNAINAYRTLNVEVVGLKTDIDDCRSLVANDEYEEGKPALQSAIDVAQTFYDAITPAVRDSAAIMKTDSVLVAARADFYLANASLKTPGMIEIVNPTFADGSSSKGSAIPGWDAGGFNQNSKSGWGTYKSGIWTTGIALYYNRNSSTTEKKYIAQEVKLEHPGVYEFSAECKACHQNKSKNTPNNGVYWFVGDAGTYNETKFDSVGIYTPYIDGELASPVRYKVRVVISEPRSVRFGCDAIGNKAATNIDISGCEVRYFGPYDKYVADSVKAVVQPTIDSLAAEIAIAQDLKNTSRNKENCATAVQAFEAAISHAEVVKSKEVTSLADLQSLNDEITTLIAAENAYKVSGVWPAEGTFFDLTSYIRNAELTDTLSNATGELTFAEWLYDGNTAYFGEDALMTYVFNADSKADMKIHQMLEGMPAGKYQFMANATYKLETDGTTTPQDEDMNALIAQYNQDNGFYVVANAASATMKGVLTGCEEDKWSGIITSWNYRHHHPAGILDGNNFNNILTFDITAADGGKIDLGIEAKGAKATQLIWAKNFALYFWGDNAGDLSGIESIGCEKQKTDGAVYNLQGQRVTTPKHGLYILNGRKFYVK